MKKSILFVVFALLFVGFLAALGEAEGKSPPGVEMGYYDLQLLDPGVSVEVENTVDIVLVDIVLVEVDIPTLNGMNVYEVNIYTIHKTEAAVVRRHDRRLWSIYTKDVKSLYAYGHLLYETKARESKSERTISKSMQVFKTEYG